MFTAALFTEAMMWKRPKCPSTDEWIEKTWCTVEYTQWNITRPKKDEIIPFPITWMDLHLVMLSEVRQRKTNTI